MNGIINALLIDEDIIIVFNKSDVQTIFLKSKNIFFLDLYFLFF